MSVSNDVNENIDDIAELDKKEIEDFIGVIEGEHDLSSLKVIKRQLKKHKKTELRQAKLEALKEKEKEKKELKRLEKFAKRHPHVEAEKIKAKYNFRKYLIGCLTVIFITSTYFTVTKTTAGRNMIEFFTNLFFSNSKIEEELQVGNVADYNSAIRDVNNDNVGRGNLITSSSKDEQARLNALAENSRVYCIISSSPYFQNSTETGSLFISNPSESIYFTQVVINSKDTNEELYISPLLKPDEKVEYDYLTKQDLKAGVYPSLAYFNYYAKSSDNNDTDYVYIGTMCAEIDIVINY